ncbi:deoxyribose-phosphate aldolase [Glaciihabitans arcticus]|uniref:Deoxyribose-phosphate aldolase n=1 Tax=Glaciihabitans arcticus TaxID=2668039 RepID=A0A4Q9H091_9MICO|nr:deoxyribose-phosphate aldolase [Glaciihabitans arcticus]TBN58100.1 deoxyribose-phosphate aldolase [Glaciihabitans arcticus]
MSSLIAPLVDHTLLKPDTTAEDVTALIAEALELGVYSVCISPAMLPVSIPEGSGLKLAVVCGFPSGKHTTASKTAEAAESIALGADEVDMVIDLGAAKAGRFDLIEADVRAVRGVIPAPRILKVIIESAALTDEEIVGATLASVAAGADFVKTSTGFHPAGGATVHAVSLMAATVDGKLGVKASGGIRTIEDARAMIEAGATRLGLSGTRAILEEEAGLVVTGVASSY